MQIKKDDIRQDILDAASHEFVAKGYTKASLRSIAKRAHTTLGNIYNYFPSKESLLDELVGPIPDKINTIISNHNNQELIKNVAGVDNVETITNDIDKYLMELVPVLFPLDVLFSEAFIIFMEGCDGTKYEPMKKLLFDNFTAHISEHLHLSPNHQLAKIFTQSCLSAVVMIGKSKKNTASKLEDFKTYIMTLTYGFPMPPNK